MDAAPFLLNSIVRISTLTAARFVARAIAIVIKEISNPRWGGHSITNAIAAVVIDPIGRTCVIRTVIHVVWAITHVVGRVINVVWTVLHVVRVIVQVQDLAKCLP